MRNNVRGGGGGKKEENRANGSSCVWDFVRMSRQWCVNVADGEMFGDDDVPFANTVG